MANKLHELLAVEQDRKHQASKTIGETRKLFTNKAPYFDGTIKRYVALEENAEQIPDERKEIVTTVTQTLRKAQQDIVIALDATLSKEETNCSGNTKAELTVDGVSFGTFSATSLLALESQLNRLRELYNDLPTLDPAKKWYFDEQEGIYKTEAEIKFRSVKRPKVIVKYEATEKHPAQTELMHLDFQVGKYETVNSSGRLPMAEKQGILNRITNLIEAVKIARSKANSVEVNNTKVGDQLFDFIHGNALR